MVELKTEIESPINFNDISEARKITINSTTSTKIADLRTKIDGRPDRIFFGVSVDNDIYPEQFQKIYIKLQAASIDDEKIGIIRSPGGSWEMTPNQIYKGEICAISEKEDIDLYVTEY